MNILYIDTFVEHTLKAELVDENQKYELTIYRQKQCWLSISEITYIDYEELRLPFILKT